MSLPSSTSISFRPHSATSSVIEVIASYRRAQEYFLDSVSATASVPSDEGEVAEETEEDVDISFDTEAERDLLRDAYGSVVGNLQWDEDLTPTVERYDSASGLSVIAESVDQEVLTPTLARPHVGERTPLLRIRRPSVQAGVTPLSGTIPAAANNAVPVTLLRRTSQLSTRPTVLVENAVGKTVTGQSTFGQTLFNAIAILLGIGMLSEPLAFAYAGWIGGTLLIVLYGFVSCYTAKILAHIILDDPRLKSYADIGRKAFGRQSSPLVSTLFCLELFAVSVALVTLFADSFMRFGRRTLRTPTSYPVYLIPTVLVPLSVLSYASILGIFSTLLIIAVILIDGFSKPDAPGSLWSPADTNLNFRSMQELGLSFGLFMAGFAGHPVVPSLARDMIDPSQFDLMINYAFGIATGAYAVIGIAGYLMFGNSVSDEFSQDLAKHSIYPVLNKVALWGLVLTPISKYALATRPMNVTFEILLGLEPNAAASGHGAKSTGTSAEAPSASSESATRGRRALRGVLTAVERAALTLLSVAVSILVPEFSAMMAFLGASTSFLLCVIGPVSAKVALAGRCGIWDALILVVAAAMAMWGTIAAVLVSTAV